MEGRITRLEFNDKIIMSHIILGLPNLSNSCYCLFRDQIGCHCLEIHAMLSATNVHVTSMLLANHPRSRTEGPDESFPVYDSENLGLQRSVEKTSKVSLEGSSQANRTRGSINRGSLNPFFYKMLRTGH